MNTTKHQITIEFMTDMLGTVPKNKEIYAEFVASKAPEKVVSDCHRAHVDVSYGKGDDANKRLYTCMECQQLCKPIVSEEVKKELDTVTEVEEKGWTGFHSDDKGLFIYDYMIKGFIKSALEVLQVSGITKKIPAYKKWCDQLIFVYPRRLHFGMEKPSAMLERPLRAMTAQGPRVSLARSDTIVEGTQLSFEVVIINNDKGLKPELLADIFDYGSFVGLGQWRGSGGYGRFKVVDIAEVE